MFKINKTEAYSYTYNKEIADVQFDIAYSQHVLACAQDYLELLNLAGPNISQEHAQVLRSNFDVARQNFRMPTVAELMEPTADSILSDMDFIYNAAQEECKPHAFEWSESRQEYVCGKCGVIK